MRHIPFMGMLPAFLLAILWPSLAQAQCTLQCLSGTVNIPLDDNCQAVVDPAALIVNDPDCQPLTMEIFDNNGLPFPGNVLGSAQLYKIYSAQISFAGPPGQTCVTKIRAVDEIAPTILNPCISMAISCNADTSVANPAIPEPAFTDNCGPLTITWSDLVINGNCAADLPYQIRRTFIATDLGANTATCLQVLTLLYRDISEIVPPLQVVNLNCGGSPFDLDITDQPFLDGEPLMTGGYCGFTVTYSDTFDPNPPANPLSIGRLWTVTDCKGNTATYEQLITVNDTEDPQITCPADLTVAADDNFCSATTVLPAPTVVDTCSGLASILASADGNPFVYGQSVTLSVGVHVITYTAVDVVGNTSSCTFSVTVQDQSPPMISCKSFAVTLQASGTVVVLAPDFLFTSNDNCGLGTVLARRTDVNPLPPFGPSVTFTCDDVMNSPISVEVAAFDLSGNGDTCTAQVTVQDKIAPLILECPSDTLIDCNEFNADFFATSTATFTDACGEVTTYLETDLRDKCGTGPIVRQWTSTDPSGNSAICIQNVEIVNGSPLTDSLIIWPPDTILYTCTPVEFLEPDILGPPHDKPTVDQSVCSIIAIGHTDEVLVVAKPGCYKILRTWTVIDCCVYDPQNPSAGGIFTHVQLLKVMDPDPPVIDCPPTLEVAADGDCGTSYVKVPILQVDDCNPNVKVTNNSPYSDKKGADASGTYPYGKTKVTFTANDMCGNFSHCTLEIVVTDLTAPTPICHYGLSVDLGLCAGMIVAKVNAEFFNNKSYDNCSLKGDLQFSFSPDVTDVDTMFTCDQLDTNYVQIWVTDENGNQDYCKTYIVVQDNMDLCPGGKPVKIQGTVIAESGDPVSGAKVLLTGPVNQQFVTGANGTFTFTGLPSGEDYQVTASKADDVLKGVSTYDLLLIQKHILGVKQITHGPSLLAADANTSGGISIADIILLRKWLLSPPTDVSPNKAWRFLNPAIPMNPTNPLQTPGLEIIPLTQVTSDVQGVDLAAVKVGDINGDAFDAGLWDELVRGGDESLLLEADDVRFEPGDEVTIELHTRGFRDIQSWQMALGWDADMLSFSGIRTVADELDMDASNIGLDEVGKGLLRLSWDDPYGVSLQDGSAVLRLSFTALKAGRASETLKVLPEAMLPEVVSVMSGTSGAADLASGVGLHWAETATDRPEAFILYPNKPNPFRDLTMIGFRLPEAADVTLTLLDVSGQVITQFRGRYPGGYHEIPVPGEILPPSGVIYYRMEGPTFSETRKMIRQ